MKRYDFRKSDYDDVKIICEYDGDVGYCNSLGVNGLCKCADHLCQGAVAVIATKNGFVEYLALED